MSEFQIEMLAREIRLCLQEVGGAITMPILSGKDFKILIDKLAELREEFDY